MIVLGESSDELKKGKFHNLDYLYSRLIELVRFCDSKNITTNLMPVKRSKYLFFDYRDKTVCLNTNSDDKVFNIADIEVDSTPLSYKDKSIEPDHSK